MDLTPAAICLIRCILNLRMEDFYGAERYQLYGKEVCFWRTVETCANSINYFTDGTISEEYFVVEGYMKNKGECCQ